MKPYDRKLHEAQLREYGLPEKDIDQACNAWEPGLFEIRPPADLVERTMERCRPHFQKVREDARERSENGPKAVEGEQLTRPPYDRKAHEESLRKFGFPEATIREACEACEVGFLMERLPPEQLEEIVESCIKACAKSLPEPRKSPWVSMLDGAMSFVRRRKPSNV